MSLINYDIVKHSFQEFDFLYQMLNYVMFCVSSIFVLDFSTLEDRNVESTIQVQIVGLLILILFNWKDGWYHLEGFF